MQIRINRSLLYIDNWILLSLAFTLTVFTEKNPANLFYTIIQRHDNQRSPTCQSQLFVAVFVFANVGFSNSVLSRSFVRAGYSANCDARGQSEGETIPSSFIKVNFAPMDRESFVIDEWLFLWRVYGTSDEKFRVLNIRDSRQELSEWIKFTSRANL